ncbi:MAG: DUF2125 domain-containing protein [Pseudomonadota bacterium]
MKRLLIVILVAAALWAGYWFIGARTATANFEAWFAQRSTEGWVAENSGIVTRGFPNRFDTTISDITLADPDTGVAYTAPFLQIFALSYKPEHLIAVWPTTQQLATPFGAIGITSTKMRTSLVVDASSNAAIERSQFEAMEMALAFPDGREAKADAVNAAIEKLPAAQAAYHFGLDAKGLVLPQPAALKLQTGDLLPDALERARADVTMTFDAPWDLDALQSRRPQPTRIDVRLIEARWGQLDLKIAGALDVNTQGQPTGKLTIKAQNWRDILTLAVASGMLPEQMERPIDQGLSLLSGLSGNPKTLDLPLDFANGRVFLGPIPLGPAPRLVLR